MLCTCFHVRFLHIYLCTCSSDSSLDNVKMQATVMDNGWERCYGDTTRLIENYDDFFNISIKQSVNQSLLISQSINQSLLII